MHVVTNKRERPHAVRLALVKTIDGLDYTSTLPLPLQQYIESLPADQRASARAAVFRTFQYIKAIPLARARQVLAWLDGTATARDVERGLHTEHGRHRAR
jgi:hypothetical protein